VPSTVHASQDFACSPLELFDVLTDEAFLRARAERFSGTDEAPSVQRDGGLVRVSIPRALPLEHVPSWSRRFVGDGRLLQVDSWHDHEQPITGAMVAETGRSFVNLDGSMEIAASEGGCRYSATARITVRVPGIGGKAESMAARHLQELLEEEQRFTAAWVAGDREV